MAKFDITLVAKEERLAKAFQEHCGDIESVSVVHGSIFDVACDAMVSPANSFGFMDGGIDALYSWRFGKHIQDSLRLAILQHWQGELPVGASEIIDTRDSDTPFLISAPTMRVPMVLSDETINPYLAMRADIMMVRNGVFRSGPHQGEAVSKHVKHVAVPGLGTGVGRVSAQTCAFQVAKALKLHLTGKHYLPKSWTEAQENHADLLGIKIEN